MVRIVPLPRPPIDDPPPVPSDWPRWYETEFGWPVSEGDPPRLVTGVRFDVLQMPAAAGEALLRRFPPGATGPVSLLGPLMRFLVAPGAADELPGLLDWLEWRGVDLDLTAIGEGGRITAPAPPGHPEAGRRSPGAAVWLRPPEPGGAEGPALPTLPSFGRAPHAGASPDLVRLVAAAATECHRAGLLRAGVQSCRAADQPLAFS